MIFAAPPGSHSGLPAVLQMSQMATSVSACWMKLTPQPNSAQLHYRPW